MSYEILSTAEGLSILHITKAHLDSFAGWHIEFHDGREAMVYNQTGEWMQYEEQWLDVATLLAIGNCIDSSLVKSSAGIAEHYFYDMLN